MAEWIGFRLIVRLTFLSVVFSGLVEVARADKFVYDTPDGRQSVEGKLTARTTAEVLFLARDGRMHLVNAVRVVEMKQSDDQPKPFTKEEMIVQLRGEFGAGFRVFTTNRYVICHNSDSNFARSCGRLFERLHAAFTNYFEQQAGFEVKPNEYPLVAIVFGNERDFLAYAQRELGDEMARNVIGYYSFLTNRMVLYDMMAGGARGGLGNVVGKGAMQGPLGIGGFNQANIGTVIHEATHQLAYNSGFHQRFSDNPLWLAEGMAMFFEAPNRQAANWKGIGEINRLRLDLFREQHLATGGKPVNLVSLIRDDERLRDKRTALVAYADSWSLTYYFMKTRREQFYDYLRILAKKPPLTQDSPEQRVADFKAAFGQEVDQVEVDFVRFMRTLPVR